MLNRRLALAKRIVERRGELDIAFFDLFYNVFGPASRFKSRPFISSINQPHDGFRQINFFGFAKPLYLPTGLNTDFIYQIVCELFRPQEWHYYEISETKVMPNDYVLDAGAAEGLFAYLVADRCQKVYAVEPLPDFISSMKKKL